MTPKTVMLNDMEMMSLENQYSKNPEENKT